ncbi:MAG TPA: ATP-binding protein [Fodinibius sp.]|nr:ATP-binding protein [Fodinibius sp.]
MKKRLILPSEPDSMEKVEPFIDKLQDWMSLDTELRDRIMLPLSEAVNNAIIHGNKLQEDKSVTIVARQENRFLVISVEDEGEGFNPRAIPDPLNEKNLLKEGGRGIYLIRQYTDDLHFEKNGSRIIMSFAL